MTDTIANALRGYREQAGLNQAQLADRLGVSQATVSRWEAGKQQPESRQLLRLMSVAPDFFSPILKEIEDSYEPKSGLIRVPVIGAVQAGVFIEAVEWPPEDRYEVYVPGSHRLLYSDILALEVAGRSMENIYPPGTIVAYTPIENFFSARREMGPEFAEHDLTTLDKRNVVVFRYRNDDTIEATVKALEVGEDGHVWLWPRSRDPKFQAPIRLDDGDNIKEVRIVGVVVCSIRPEE